MTQLPPGLPPANSRKWHGRRLWDSLGYLRVRSLANPGWDRDMPWLVSFLEHERLTVTAPGQPLIDKAIGASRRYPRTSAGITNPDAAWDEVLECIDEFLTVRQANHLAEVHRPPSQ